MKKNKKADSIAWIIIAVFILSFAMLWIVNVLDYNKDMTYNYEKETDSYVLKSNSDNILKRLNISELWQDEIFYIRKDNVNNEFLILTWSTNEHYKYVDKNWNNIFDWLNIQDITDLNWEIIIPEKYIWKTFIREFQKKIDILRHDIKPPEIRNLVFHFDANNIDWNYNQWINSLNPINNWDTVSVWRNIANNGVPNAVDKSTINTGRNIYYSQLPTLNENWINNLPMVEFNWINQMLWMERHELINNDWDSFSNRVFMEKSFAIVFKTWFDITNRQVVYEQWWAATWYNFMIEDWDVWAWVHNIACDSRFDRLCNVNYADRNFSNTRQRYFFTWDNWHKHKSVRLWEVLPNTVYFVMVVQDSTHLNRTNKPIIEDVIDRRFIHENNRLKIFLNWNLVDETDHVSPMPEHSYGWLWNVFAWSVSPATREVVNDISPYNQTAYFQWWIWELISRNHALSENEVRWVQNYFEQKWLWWRQTVRYDIVNTNTEEFRNY